MNVDIGDTVHMKEGINAVVTKIHQPGWPFGKLYHVTYNDGGRKYRVLTVSDIKNKVTRYDPKELARRAFK